MPVKIAKIERGTASFAVVNRFLARLLEMVSPPRDRLPSSLFWSAKDEGGYGGGKTSANLAAKLSSFTAVLTASSYGPLQTVVVFVFKY